MILNDLEHYIESEWDDYVSHAAGVVPISEARDALVPKVADYLKRAERDFEAEAKTYIQSTLEKVRKGRTAQLKRDLEFVIDYMEDPENGTLGVLAMLDRAYPMGLSKGEDKALRYWTQEDVQKKIQVRYRHAADATAEAREFDEIGTTVILKMQAAGALTLGDMIDIPDRKSA